MQINKIALIILIAVFAFGITTFLTRSSQSQSKDTQQQQKLEDEIPTVSINAPEEINPDKKELRRKRGQKYSNGTPLENLKDPVYSLLEAPGTHTGVNPAFPVKESVAVVIGTITDAQAVLTGDKSNVYSEFTVRIEEELKNSTSFELKPNTIITTERGGGIVRFSPDNTLRLGFYGRGFPQKQKRYLLFLKWNDSENDFSIVTGYKLEGGKVMPLDGNGDESFEAFKDYQSYKNKDETSFLKIVRDAIANPNQKELNR